MSSSTAIVLVGLAAVAVLALSNSRAPPPPPQMQPPPQQIPVQPLLNEKQDNTARDWAMGIKIGSEVANKIAEALRKWI